MDGWMDEWGMVDGGWMDGWMVNGRVNVLPIM